MSDTTPQPAVAEEPPSAFFADTEATGLRRPYLKDGRQIWEIGGERVDPGGTEHVLHLFIRISSLNLPGLISSDVLHQHNLTLLDEFRADGTVFDLDRRAKPIPGTWYDLLPADVQKGLDIGGFHERHPERGGDLPAGAALVTELEAAHELMAGPWLRGEPTLVGAVPNFEDLGLFDLLYRAGHVDGYGRDPWHYHLVCAETYAAGALGWGLRWDSDELAAALALNPTDWDRHTALGDARWARAMYEAARMLARDRAGV